MEGEERIGEICLAIVVLVSLSSYLLLARSLVLLAGVSCFRVSRSMMSFGGVLGRGRPKVELLSSGPLCGLKVNAAASSAF